MENNNQKNNNLILILSTVLITALVMALGIFGYKEFIGKDKKEDKNNGNNGNVVTPTATPTVDPMKDQLVTSIENIDATKLPISRKIVLSGKTSSLEIKKRSDDHLYKYY